MGADVDKAARQAGAQRERLQALYQLASEIAERRDLPQVRDVALRPCRERSGAHVGFMGLHAVARMLRHVAASRRGQIQPDLGRGAAAHPVRELVAAGASPDAISASRTWSSPSVQRPLHPIVAPLGTRNA